MKKTKQKKPFILNCKNISQNCSLLYFWSNKCSLGELKRLLLKKHYKISLTPNFWMVVYLCKCTFQIHI